ncbi:MAG: tRNA (N(6)-L-threonylcarbamoyladenosine(37)-C(2))-methylthiotransferase MtaB [Bacteroidia bacterium]|nr:tRNA (N(6)-L-threonylcarbamoyladenosine(37)-C(2))-methylthiotransferase MtaB [Bacteroidia bacterium]
MNKTVSYYTLGCKLNYSETSTISRMFAQAGFQKVDFENGADVYVINTCSVTEHADKKCRKVVQQALKFSPNALIIIVGCYAQLKPEEIVQIPGVDVVLGAAEKFQLLDIIQNFEKRSKPEIHVSEIKQVKHFTDAYSIGDRTRSFLKIQDGCDYHCSFCTIPLARGASRSDTLQNVLQNAKYILAQGVKEIVLTGVNIGDYGKNLSYSFLDLIQKIDELEGDFRVRISSIEPNLLTNTIIDFVAQSRHFMPHFHIPLQSGNNEILARMQRRYKRELYKDRVDYIKSIMPHACIGVDVIVGFPSETEAHFLDTYQFINELDVSYLHVFTYSERDNTKALSIKPVVPFAERKKRNRMLTILSEKKRRYFYEQNLQKTYCVLFEQELEGNHIVGFTENYIKVQMPYDPLMVNELVTVILQGISPEGNVIGEVKDNISVTHSVT